MSDILGLLKRAHPYVARHWREDDDGSELMRDLGTAILRLERAEIVEGSGLMMWDGSPYVRFSPTGHIQFMGLRPAVLIVLEVDDE